MLCLFTVRADGAARLFQAIDDVKLEVPETLPLLPLPQSAYRDVILKPLDVLARRGNRLTLSPLLADRLVADASGADALPLLAFTISHLYREFGTTGNLTSEQYDVIGGILQARSTWHSSAHSPNPRTRQPSRHPGKSNLRS